MQGQATPNIDEIRERLTLLQLRLNGLQLEVRLLQRALATEVVQGQSWPTLASLYGVWSDAGITDQDLEDARLRTPEGLE